jgi:hypothetical protein
VPKDEAKDFRNNYWNDFSNGARFSAGYNPEFRLR